MAKWRKRSSKGFSLLELMIVVLIVGVIIGLVFPRVMELFGFSHITEAFEHIGIIHRAIGRCKLMAGSDMAYTECDEFQNLDIDNPNQNPEGSYKYKIGVIYWGDKPSSVIQATRRDYDKSESANEKVLVIYDPPEEVGGKTSYIMMK